jgi:hypothetical protein
MSDSDDRERIRRLNMARCGDVLTEDDLASLTGDSDSGTGIPRIAPEPSRPRNLGSNSKCHGGRGTAAKPNSVKVGIDAFLFLGRYPQNHLAVALPRPAHGA